MINHFKEIKNNIMNLILFTFPGSDWFFVMSSEIPVGCQLYSVNNFENLLKSFPVSSYLIIQKKILFYMSSQSHSCA
jgi:hypothetical protein